MKREFGTLWTAILIIALVFSHLSFAKKFARLTSKEMLEVVKIARAIHTLNPKLDDPKYFEYALGIFFASQKYRIDPRLLISIAQRETNFRENLPEGAAGELGICQIRKMWIKNQKFRAEFKNTKTKDFLRPAKSFLFAAWILKDLKDNAPRGTLPFWSYYNAVGFEPRYRYFITVNRNISALLRHESNEPAEVGDNGAVFVHAWDPTVTARTEMADAGVQSVAMASPKILDVRTPPARLGRIPVPRVENVPSSETSARWIPDALMKLQENRRAKEEVAAGGLTGKQPSAQMRKRSVYPSIIRAAAELGVEGWFRDQPVED